MNRRGFVASVGTLAAAGAAARALHRPGSGAAPSGGIDPNGKPIRSSAFIPSSHPAGTTRMDAYGSGPGVTLGYIPGSGEFITAHAAPAERLAFRGVWREVSTRSAIGILGYVASAAPTIERLDITVNFVLSEPPFAAPFYAWQYVNLPGQHAKSSSPLKFATNVPGAAGLSVAFRVKNAASGAIASGVLDYPIGGSGLGSGIYALAGPSPATNGEPDWAALTWGDTAGSLARLDGQAVDFDYVTLVLRPDGSA